MSDDRLKPCLAEQVDFLRASGQRFDAGHPHEAKRLALTIRVLLYDTNNSRSLLEQLGLKSELAFLDTRTRPKPAPGFQISEQVGWPTGMVIMQATLGGPSWTFRATLGSSQESRPAEVPFDVWWEEPLIVSQDGTEWNRRRFILGAANQEGGGHVDPKPSAWWRDLRDGTWMGAAKYQGPEGWLPMSDLAPAVIRQITRELLMALEAAGHAEVEHSGA